MTGQPLRGSLAPAVLAARPVSREVLTAGGGRCLPATRRPRREWWADRAADAAVVPACVVWVVGMVQLGAAFLA